VEDTNKEIEKLFSKIETGLLSKEDDAFLVAEDDDESRHLVFPDSMQTGFHDVSPKSKPKPNYQDLKKYFSMKGEYVVNTEERSLYRWEGKKWRPMQEVEVENFAQTNFFPPANTTMTKEFLNLIYRTNIQDRNFFIPTGKINFSNGIYSISTGLLTPHSSSYGFRYCLPSAYDPVAECPRWEQYLNEVTEMDAHAIMQLEEFLAYTVFQCEPSWGQKALILLGDGRRKGGNGKSVFCSMAKKLVGEGGYSALNLKQLSADVALGLLENKSLNICEEIEHDKGFDSSNFKSIADGGHITVRKLYKGQFLVKPVAKMIFACNELPTLKDDGGIMRRLIIIEFRRVFAEHEQDRTLVSKLTAEIPGIFNRLISAYGRLMDRGGFSNVVINNEALEDYKFSQLNAVDLWIDDRLMADAESHTDLKNCYNDFKTWHDVKGYRRNDLIPYPIFSRQVGRNLRVKRKRSNNERFTVLVGFKLSSMLL
jgi:P4 family phage/plasmid primase-like protien